MPAAGPVTGLSTGAPRGRPRGRRPSRLRESVEAGLAVELTERAAQEAAISSFGSVRAVVRAHAHRVPPVTARDSFDACFAPDEAKKRWKTGADDFAARNAPVAA